jgi:hypothetical protein
MEFLDVYVSPDKAASTALAGRLTRLEIEFRERSMVTQGNAEYVIAVRPADVDRASKAIQDEFFVKQVDKMVRRFNSEFLTATEWAHWALDSALDQPDLDPATFKALPNPLWSELTSLINELQMKPIDSQELKARLRRLAESLGI